MIKPTRKRVLKQIKSFRRISADLNILVGNLQYRGELLLDDNAYPIPGSLAIFMSDEEIADRIEKVCGGFKKE